MSAASKQRPHFWIGCHRIQQLQAQGRPAWYYYAETTIQLVGGAGTRRQASPRLPMRLDSGAFMSFLPEEWFQNPHMQRFLGSSLGAMSFQTATTHGTGTLYCDLRTLFEHDSPSHEITFHALVTPHLNGRGYGLLALEDVLNHFLIQIEGDLLLKPDREPVRLPNLILIPWPSPAQWLCYRCSGCEAAIWGRSGLRLRCEDCDLLLDAN